MGGSRLDFLLTDLEGTPLSLEVKSGTLVEDDGVGEAAVLFSLQRDDARRIEAARSIVPVFAAALERARDAGVRILGRRCHVGLEGVTLGERVPADVGCLRGPREQKC